MRGNLDLSTFDVKRIPINQTALTTSSNMNPQVTMSSQKDSIRDLVGKRSFHQVFAESNAQRGLGA